MLIKLPRPYLGRHIIETFKIASTFEEEAARKWEATQDVVVNKTGRLIIPSIVVKTSPYALKRKWLIGKKVWVQDTRLSIILEPIFPLEIYDSIQVSVEYTDCDDPLMDIGPEIERLYLYRHGHVYPKNHCYPPNFRYLWSSLTAIITQFFIQLREKNYRDLPNQKSFTGFFFKN